MGTVCRMRNSHASIRLARQLVWRASDEPLNLLLEFEGEKKEPVLLIWQAFVLCTIEGRISFMYDLRRAATWCLPAEVSACFLQFAITSIMTFGNQARWQQPRATHWQQSCTCGCSRSALGACLRNFFFWTNCYFTYYLHASVTVPFFLKNNYTVFFFLLKNSDFYGTRTQWRLISVTIS